MLSGILAFTIKRLEELLWQKKRATSALKIPFTDAHTKVRQRQAESGETLSRYMTALITKYYEMEENVKMDKDNVRTVAFQVPTELFERLKAYTCLKRNSIKQNAFFLDCIRQALARTPVPPKNRNISREPAEILERFAFGGTKCLFTPKT